ncbi:hypothetical protein NKH77_50990 [Streptomyces sp. M19]
MPQWHGSISADSATVGPWPRLPSRSWGPRDERSRRGGQPESYQRRYRHEKAMRGFLVDGGRILGEVARAVATRYGAAVMSDVPSRPNSVVAAGLDPPVLRPRSCRRSSGRRAGASAPRVR